MKQIVWFRRDLRVEDNKILEQSSGKVMPIFIFDKNILSKLKSDDKRVTFIYDAVLNLKKSLQNLGLDLYVFYDEAKNVFNSLKPMGFDEVLCSCDFDSYAKKRDEEIEQIIPMRRFYDSFLTHPNEALKADKTPYKVFTPFYKSLSWLWESSKLTESKINPNIKLIKYEKKEIPSLEEMGFKKASLEKFFTLSVKERVDSFEEKLDEYKDNRDIFYKDGTSNLGVDLRFGTISPRILFNKYKKSNHKNVEVFIRQLFWREFFNYILYHFPKSENQNWNGINLNWNQNEDDFIKWCEGKTGVAIVDAAMIHLNKTGTMPNRLRMIVASFLTKNLFIDWRRGEEYFASKLLDYEASSNIGSWQWSASTGADAAPYFRVFNPYSQSEKFDKDGIFIKSVIPSLKDVDSKLFHKEGALSNGLFSYYIPPIVDIKLSRQKAIDSFKMAKNEKA